MVTPPEPPDATVPPVVDPDVVADLLDGQSPDRRSMFHARLRRWQGDLHAGLAEVYESDVAAELATRVVRSAAVAFVERDDDLHRLDLDRILAPDWLQHPRMVGYAAYTERFAGTLEAVVDRIPYLQELGVTYLHLMPLMQPRAGDDDGGYAVADHRTVRPDLGTVDDLRDLATQLRGAGISLVLDLVVNHVADDHPWARAARDGDAEKRAWFHVFEDRTVPDAFEATLPEVFPDFAPGNFTFVEDLDAWVWTTFNDFQWDLDWSNPDVFAAFVDIVLYLANLGVEVVRLDAIAFLWKRLGTTCQGQPEVHALVRALRAVARIACPAVAFKAEAIVAPGDLVAYLGHGRFTGRVSDLAYHNSLMVQAWSMLATGEVWLAARALSELPDVPTSSTWITYLRCHDDIGWAIDDGDAAAVGVTGHGHRSFLADWFSGDFPGSPARGLVFQHNPATGDRRTSGTAASLVGLEAAEEAGDPAAVDLAVAALRMAHALVYGWGGVPVLWSGDELGQPNDADWAQDPRHADDNRWAHRPVLDHDRAARRHDPSTVPGRVFADLATLARVRAGLERLHAGTQARIGPLDDPGVLVTVRDHPIGRLVGLYNVTAEHRPWHGHRVDELGMDGAVDALTGYHPERGVDGHVWLEPYGVRWLVHPD
ncbi:alpha-amylase family protein [Salsipaludibacter albus]|uniref:alpha-amylase family protein n=1 Tax=Salsipaludibacter albus TaxID=2849650 RepID=UPI002367E381|nr:alpha-amylase family protein [Salsipaludibacter albus]MBY5162713.1 alpha-amylase family protein [Salsipaludibacter albus]